MDGVDGLRFVDINRMVDRMKLVEILAEEMEEWPKGVTHLTQSAVDREIYNAQDGKDTYSLESLEPRFDAIKSHDERGEYPVVTRAQ